MRDPSSEWSWRKNWWNERHSAIIKGFGIEFQQTTFQTRNQTKHQVNLLNYAILSNPLSIKRKQQIVTIIPSVTEVSSCQKMKKSEQGYGLLV